MKAVEMRRLLFLLGLFLASTAPLAHAQVLNPSVDRHTLEIGYIYKWYERDFESTFLGREDWSSGTIYLRFGTCRWATISFEGGMSTIDSDDFANIEYRRYTVGGGLTVLCVRRSTWRVEAAGHYSEIFDHDRSQYQLHKNVRDLVVAIQFEKFFAVRDQSVVLWGGPAYVVDQSRQYPWGTYIPVKDDTSNNLGFVAGASAVLFGRVSVFTHGVYADTFQPRVGAGLQF
jgi:hypothetical protein